MRAKILTAAVASLLLTAFSVSASHATALPTAQYAFGWNMVGGPPGSDFSNAQALFVWNGSTYIKPSTATTTLCQGEWAYFATSTTLVLTGTPPSTTSQTCSLQAGWNMIGNPFSSTATLPTGTTAFYWNPTTNSYQAASSIPVGAAVWVYATTAGSITLQPSSTPTTGPTTIIFGRQGGNIQPFQVTISSSGAVTTTGPAGTTITQVGQAQVAALLQQAQTIGFFNLPPTTNCVGTLPDVATLYIAIQTGNLTQPYRVDVHGNCVASFNQLYAALRAMVGISA